MKFIRKLFFFGLAALLVWVGIFTYNRLTDGFNLRQMASSLPPCPEFVVPLSKEKKEELQNIVTQTFRYIGKGCQFYVFESEDGKFIIKFLKHKHLRPFTWLNSLPMPDVLRARCAAKIARRAERVQRLFTSCKLAYEKMPEETGLLYIHLDRIPALEKEVLLIDKVGFKHKVAIDNYEYIVQKKAITVKEAFAHLNGVEVSANVQKLADLVRARCQKGIRDRDRAFVQNVAFLKEEQRAVFIDIGQFYEDPAILLAEEQEKDLKRRLSSLYIWTQGHYPHLVPLMDKLL